MADDQQLRSGNSKLPYMPSILEERQKSDCKGLKPHKINSEQKHESDDLFLTKLQKSIDIHRLE